MFFFCYNFFDGDSMNYKKYLFDGISNPSIFKKIDIKNDIINNDSRHEITWFCQDNNVTSEMIYNLLDDEGINILNNTRDKLSRVNGIISCGKDISNLFDNEVFLSLLIELDNYYFYFKEDEALKFIKYCINNKNEIVVRAFNKLNENAQIYVISNCDMSEFYYDLLVGSKLGCSKIIVDKISSLENYKYDDLFDIFEKDMVIPNRLLSMSFINKISTIYNVKAYRSLVNELGKNNDISNIEILRRKYYDYFLDNCSDIYNNILSEVKSGSDISILLNKYFNCFGGYDSFLNNGFFDIDEKLKKSLNYITSEIVIDYLFQDNAYNVFLDINELLKFSTSVDFLSEDDKKIYSDIVSLDDISVFDKKKILDNLKNKNMAHKFYDDFRLARSKMVELFNSSILNSDNIYRYENKELSNKYGVPVYEMNGNEFFVLVKAIEKRKDSILNPNDLYAYCDGSSFSIDGGNKLSTFLDTNMYYNLAYNRIPDNQLVHVFEVDSFSNYYRNKNNNLPYDRNGTDRINRLFTPKEIVDVSSSYNELIISQPNQMNDEFNSKLEQPVPFAIYCYDDISDHDILSSKATGLGIILVNTKKYDIDKFGRVSLHSLDNSDICYAKPNENDDIYKRGL